MPSPRSKLILLCGVLSLVAYPTVNYHVTDHLLFSSEKNRFQVSGNPPSLFLHENLLQMEAGNYQVRLQVSNQFAPDHSSRETSLFSLEKKAASAQWGVWELTAGDSHQELGKGIALSLYKDDVFGQNNTLEGIALKYSPDSAEAFIAAGRINTLKSPVALSPVEDPLLDRHFWLAAAGVRMKPFGDSVTLGTHSVVGLSQLKTDSRGRIQKSWHTVGLSYSHESVLTDVDFYFESNFLFRKRLGLDTLQPLPPGFGSYGAIVWSPVPWILKCEVKDYRNDDFEFKRPPTLEEDIIETTNTSDVIGTRLTLERVEPQTKAGYRLSYLFGQDRLLDTYIHHGVAGARWQGPLSIGVEMRLGYRLVEFETNMLHAAMKLKIHTLEKQILEIGLRKQYAELNVSVTPATEDKNILDVAYTFNRHLGVAFAYELIPTNEASNQHFVNGGINYKEGALLAKAFAGQTSGGTLCSGGVCRQRPPFTGAFFETIYSF